ncbi:hypothetical protein ABKV19_022648 [Rosa sericea]
MVMAMLLSPLKPLAYSTSAFSQDPSSSYRPAVLLPGLGNNSADYKKLEITLRGYGVSTVVAKVARIDWLRNAAGLVDPNYWRGTLSPRPVLDVIIEEFPGTALKITTFSACVCCRLVACTNSNRCYQISQYN